MAKKVTDNNKTSHIPGEESLAPMPEGNTEMQVPKEGSETSGKRQEIPAHVDRILRTFSRYPELYIDFQGGTFTVDTPLAFRSNATRYTNPYYKF